MKTLKNWALISTKDNLIQLNVDNKHVFCIYILEDDIFRILVKKNDQLIFDRSWSIAPKGDIPWEGRHRLDCSDFSLPEYKIENRGEELIITSAKIRLTIKQPLQLHWEFLSNNDQWVKFAEDRSTGAYKLNAHGEGVAHYQRRHKSEYYYGLGEKSGDLNRAGRRFEMRNLDAMGYNAQSTDPLYKHLPFVITRCSNNNVSFGIFYDNLSHCWLDLGNELDNYHQPYRYYQSEFGDLDYYIFPANSILDVTKTFVRLTGKNRFMPKWSLGYSGSTMQYTDAPNAQEKLQLFIKHCQQHNIACDSFQLSSGYTSIGNKRYVFNWNKDKVPQPTLLAKTFKDAGLHLVANIKPCLLQDHPLYEQVKEQGLFVYDSESNEPERSVFWDDEGSHLDFTNPLTIKWWQDNVTNQLLKVGIESTWNDNNEYEIWDNEARCHGFGKPIAIKYIRPLMPLLMMRASLEAQQQFSPDKRPYLISRSGCAGMQRYAQTWSGDNRTSWQTLRYNIRMGLGMSLSGLYNVGHDVGGFSGDKPDAELFVRWVQNGVMHPRFTIHSWNDDGSVNEPWMYSHVTPIIQKMINLRYQLMPYFYNLLWQATENDEPMLRPTFLDHEHDEQTFAENDDFMIGTDLLVASVVEPGQRERNVYLPDNNTGWYCFYTGEWFSGNQCIHLPAPLEQLPLLVRAGSVIPMSAYIGPLDKLEENQRELVLFPQQGCNESNGVIFEDDGESYGYQKQQALWLSWIMKTDNNAIYLNLSKKGEYQPGWQSLVAVLPKNERRTLYINEQLINEITLALI